MEKDNLILVNKCSVEEHGVFLSDRHPVVCSDPQRVATPLALTEAPFADSGLILTMFQAVWLDQFVMVNQSEIGKCFGAGGQGSGCG